MSPPGALRRPGAAFFRDALDPHTAAMTDGQSSASELMPELAPELAPSST